MEGGMHSGRLLGCYAISFTRFKSCFWKMLEKISSWLRAVLFLRVLILSVHFFSILMSLSSGMYGHSVVNIRVL